MIDKSARTLMKRFGFAKSQFELYKPRLLECYEFTQPYRNDFYTETEGQIKGKEILDPTAINATNKFVSALQKLLTPSNKRFMVLKATEQVSPSLRKQLSDKLAEVNNTIWHYIDKSRGILAMSETYYDIACGTGALQIRSGSNSNPLIFSAHPISSIYLERSIINTIQNVWREYYEPCADIPIMWPNATIPTSLQNIINSSQGNERVYVQEGLLLDFDRGSNKESYYYVVLYNGEKIYEEEMASSPWIIYRWMVAPKESYGIGVTNLAIGSIRSLNKLMEQLMMQGDMALMPPYMYDSDMGFNVYNTRIQPNSMIPVTNISNDPIRALKAGGDLGWGAEMLQYLEQKINQIYYTDPLGSFENPVRTATEMTMRNQSNVDNMEGPFSRLAIEFLTAMFRRILFILQEKGLVDNIEIDGQAIDLYFEIPLMQAQGLDSLSKLIEAKEAISAISGPRVATLAFNNTEVPAAVAQLVGADPRLVKGPEQIESELKKIFNEVSKRVGA